MSTILEASPRRGGNEHAGGTPESESESASGARFGAELARAVLEARDVDGLLRAVAREACAALRIERCSAYLRGDDGFVGHAAHPSAIEGAVRGLRLGGPQDSLTRKVVAARRPLVLRDLHRDPDMALGALRTWNVTAVLAVPLVRDEQVLGLLIFDNAGHAHPLSEADADLAGAIADAAVSAIVRLREGQQLSERVRALGLQNRVLAHTTAVDRRLGAVLLDGGGIDQIVAVVAETTGKPVAVYDSDGHRVAESPAGEERVRLLEQLDGQPDVAELLDGAPAGGCATVPARLAAGLRHRHLLAPIDLHDRRWGWIALAERGSRLSQLDDRTLRRAAAHLTIELTVQRRTAVASLDARSTLARLLIRGTHEGAEVARCAAFLGVSLTTPRVVAYVTDTGPDGSGPDSDRLVAALGAQGLTEVLVTKGPEGVALMIEVSSAEPAVVAVRGVKGSVSAACATLDEPGLVVGISTVCRDPKAMPRAYREARETARCILGTAAASSQRVLAADDLGPARLFVANGDAVAIDRFVDDVLGVLLDGDDTILELLRTLHVFFETGRNVRGSASALGIHENTVRYRLARVHQLTGLDVAADANDQLSVQMALLVLRLQGHQALPSFDAPLPSLSESTSAAGPVVGAAPASGHDRTGDDHPASTTARP